MPDHKPHPSARPMSSDEVALRHSWERHHGQINDDDHAVIRGMDAQQQREWLATDPISCLSAHPPYIVAIVDTICQAAASSGTLDTVDPLLRELYMKSNGSLFNLIR